MMVLPSDYELQKLLSAGLNETQIAKQFGVTQQAVGNRLNYIEIYRKGPKSPVSSVIPWDISQHPEKKRLTQQASFRGLRGYVRNKMGETLTERAKLDVRAFLNRVRQGYVLDLMDGPGFAYVPREASDGLLVVRWPEGVPRDGRTALLEDNDRHAER